MTYYTYYDSPIQRMLLTSDGESLTGVYFENHKGDIQPKSDWTESKDAAPFPETARQLDAYYAGKLTDFDLPLSAAGTDFQRLVWSELSKIPHGETITYGELARRVGNPNASRAVGLANGKNPLSIIVPCHRVIGANGKLTGYAGGEAQKAKLLDLERAHRLQPQH